MANKVNILTDNTKKFPTEAFCFFIGAIFILWDPFSLLSSYNLLSNILLKILLAFTWLICVGSISVRTKHMKIFKESNKGLDNISHKMKYTSIFLILLCAIIISLTY